MTVQNLVEPYNSSYFHLVSIFTPVYPSDSNNFRQPTGHAHLRSVEINYDCKQKVDRLFQPSHQVPYPDTPLFLRLAKLEQQQALLKDQSIGNQDMVSSTGDDRENAEEHVSFENDASHPESPCDNIIQVVLSQIEQILSDEDDGSVEFVRSESFSESDC